MGIRSYLSRLNWTWYNIGFVARDVAQVSDLRISPRDIKWMDYNGYRDGWMADPFILSVSPEEIVVLAEEFHVSRGRIVRLKISRKGYKLLEVAPILQLQTHLSFPNYITAPDNQLYIYPENYQGGALKIYPYHIDTNQVGSPHTLIAEPLIDAQIADIDGRYYIFGIKCGADGRADNNVLHIYSADKLLGEYKPFQEIKNPLKRERGAGMIMILDGKLIRPVQQCDTTYGEATILRELIFDGDSFSQADIFSLSPDKDSRWGMCLHTFNQKDGIIVVDGLGYLHPKIHRLIRTLKHVNHK